MGGLTEAENEAYAKLNNGELRMIGKQRKRKLQRRGVAVSWNRHLNSFVWSPKEQQK